MIYGGSSIGLMGILADNVMQHNGKVIGFIPEHFDKQEIQQNISELHIVKSIYERKTMMAEYADGFAALPGGLGTLGDIFELINAAKLNLHSKPLVLININNYFSKLIEFIDITVAEEFLTPKERSLINIVPNHQSILEKLKGLA